MLILLAGLSGSGFTVLAAYIIYLRGRVDTANKETESLRSLIKLFSERTIVAALSDEQMRYIVTEMCQSVSLAIANLSDPERLN
jgi:hypothetical protein